MNILRKSYIIRNKQLCNNTMSSEYYINLKL